MVLKTDFPSAFSENSNTKMIGYDMTEAAAKQLYKKTGRGPQDVDVIELHDCFAANELIAYEALGLCPPGKAGELIDRGDNTYGGKWVINPSGGLISKGHPIGATGVAQCAELSWQLRGQAGKRQVAGAKLGLQHNIGIGGAIVLAMYQRGFPDSGHNSAAGINSTKTVNGLFKSQKLFDTMKHVATTEAAKIADKVNSSFRIKVTGSNGQIKEWIVDLKSRPIFIGEKISTGPVDCELTVTDDDLVSVAEGKNTTEKLFMQGKLKIKGNLMKATKLKDLLDVKKLTAKL